MSRGLIASMNPSDASAVTTVLTKYITPGPSIMRTAARSFVVRDMRSPVRSRWKYAIGSRSRCAKRSLRRSYSTWREMPITAWRIQYLKTPATTAMPSRMSA